MRKIESLDGGITQDEMQRIKKATNDNLWVKNAYTVKNFLKRTEESTTTEEIPF